MPDLATILRFLVLALVLSACGSRTGAASPSQTPVRNVNGKGVALAGAPSSTAGNGDDQGPLPIYPEDARWGDASAPVTIVAVLDFECPYCQHAEATLQQLRDHYGPEKLRIVAKHYPLPFHRFGRPAAIAAMAVQRGAGDEAFFRFVKNVYEHQAELDGAKLAQWAREAMKGGHPHPSTVGLEEQLARDRDFAEHAGVDGTPCFFVNGVVLTGTQPYEQFAAVIDAELIAQEQARAGGKGTSYSERAAMNFVAPEKAPDAPEPDEDLNTWKVPVGTSPVLGPADALVTIVEFSDYQCPYCKKVQATLDQVVAKYGTSVRIAFKHNPLPFHARALPAAELSIEAYKEKGNDAFWRASRALFDAPVEGMTDDALLAIAETLHLDRTRVKAAIQKGVHKNEIDEDAELAGDFNAHGTPHFFVNGRRLTGAQPFDSFAALVDEQLGVANALVAKGIPRNKVYDVILDHAEGPPPPVVVDLGVVPKERAFRGPASATVVVHEFSDFQCPFCSRVLPALAELRKEFPHDVKIVWHNLPLPFHSHARAAANAALEVRARGGDAAFWKMHDSLFGNQQDLSDEKLVELGKAVGVGGDAILGAIHEGRYDAVINEDQALAERGGIHGTPGFVINGYLISGAQPLAEFRRTVRRALADRQTAGKSPPPAP